LYELVFVGLFVESRIVFFLEAVTNVALAVDDQNVRHPSRQFVVLARLLGASDKVCHVLAARDAFNAERDPGHNRLFLLGYDARPLSLGADNQQVLHAERPHQQGREHQHHAHAKAVEKFKSLHHI
jgi:hypothetical protein